MVHQTSRIIIILSLLALCAGCAPESRARVKVKVKKSDSQQGTSYGGGSARPSPKTSRKNYTAIEKQIKNLESRTSRALDLIEQAYDLKKKYDNATA